jgi:hypothetical protein
MTRPTKYTPQNCPWAALVARGALPYQTAAKYRNGDRCPSPRRIEELAVLGYRVFIKAADTGCRWAVCVEWPEREG